jgi:hypothetical protein
LLVTGSRIPQDRTNAERISIFTGCEPHMKHAISGSPPLRSRGDLPATAAWESPVGDLLTAAYGVADWSEARALFAQCQQIRGGRPVRLIPDDLRDTLAVRLSSLMASYLGREELFVGHAFAVFAEATGRETLDASLFRRLYGDRSRARSSRQPATFETVVETARRLRDLNGLRGLLSGTGTSGIPCGSVSYGPFYNVRGWTPRHAASDLDLVIVAGDLDTLPAIAERIAGLPGADEASSERLRVRAALFHDRYDDSRTVFSHKVAMWTDRRDPVLELAGVPGAYQLSLHILSQRTLSNVLVESSTRLTRATAGSSRTVLDYRETRNARPDRLRTFAGLEHRVGARLEPAELGWRRWLTAYQFDDSGRYCPGFFQTILLPRFDPRWDDLDSRPGLHAFQRKYLERLRHERARDRHALLLPSLTHVRRDEFAPHVVAEFDRGSW